MLMRLVVLYLGLSLAACGQKPADVGGSGSGAGSAAGSGSEGREVIVTEDAAVWLPYIDDDPESSDGVGGAGVELLRAALIDRGYRPRFVRLPWKRAMLEVTEGRAHVLNQASSNPERERAYLRGQVPMYECRHAFYFLEERFGKAGPPCTTREQIHALRVAGVRGYNFAPIPMDPERVHEVGDTQALITFLRKGRADVAIGYPEVWQGAAMRGTIDLKGMAFIEIPGTPRLVFYPWVSRKIAGAEALRDDIDAGLRAIAKDGRRTAILARYGLGAD